MPRASYPIQMIGDVPVVTAPAEISAGNTDQLRIALLAAADRGTGLVVDMTSTRHCDRSGWHVLERAQQRARSNHGMLRLIITDGLMLAELAAAGLACVIPCCTSLREAVTLLPADRSAPAPLVPSR